MRGSKSRKPSIPMIVVPGQIMSAVTSVVCAPDAIRISVLPVTASAGELQIVTSTRSTNSFCTCSIGPRLRLNRRSCFKVGNCVKKPRIPAFACAPHPITVKTSGSGFARYFACTTPCPPAVRMVVIAVAPTSATGEPVWMSLRTTRFP